MSPSECDRLGWLVTFRFPRLVLSGYVYCDVRIPNLLGSSASLDNRLASQSQLTHEGADCIGLAPECGDQGIRRLRVLLIVWQVVGTLAEVAH
jgi:hypothetical protein